MRKRILLITGFIDNFWTQLVRDVAESEKGNLKVLAPSDMKQISELQMFNGVTFDIVLVDSSTIPAATDIVHELRSLSISKRIILLTAAPGWRQAREVFHAGADDYRLKPYDKEDLCRILGLVPGSNGV